MLAQCARLGSVRYVLDGGPHVVATIASLYEDQRDGRWQPGWEPVPPEFLEHLVQAHAMQTV